jgi:hypothetical protein
MAWLAIILAVLAIGLVPAGLIVGGLVALDHRTAHGPWSRP